MFLYADKMSFNTRRKIKTVNDFCDDLPDVNKVPSHCIYVYQQYKYI